MYLKKFHRIFLFWSAFWSFPVLINAQNFGNEWIDYSQTYYQFEVYENGMYRITYDDLNNAGVPLGLINSLDIKIFGKEKQVPLFVSDGGDGNIDPGDYIEFYAEKNDSWLDSLIYQTPDDVANKHYSLFNDTLIYFISWSPSPVSSRFQVDTDVNFPAYTPIPYVWYNSFINLNNQYLHGPLLNGASSSFFERGEGWFNFGANGGQTTQNIDLFVSTPSVYTGVGAPDVSMEAVSTSYSNASFTGEGNHHLRLMVNGNTLVDTIFIGYQLNKLLVDFPFTMLVAPNTPVRHQIVADQGVATDLQAVSTVDITYPRTTNLGGLSYFECNIPYNSSEAKSRVEFTNFGGVNPLVYIIQGGNTMKLTPQLSAGTLSVLVPNHLPGTNRKLVVLAQSSLKSVSNIEPVNGTGFFVNYAGFSGTKPYIIITHQGLWSAAQQYGDFRSSLVGGDFDVIQIDIEDLYLQFGGGIRKHSLAIKRFCDYALNTWPSQPEYLFLIGKSIRGANESTATGPGSRKNAVNFERNKVPAFGYPSSDVLLTTGINGADIRQQTIPTGRFSAESEAELLNYLNKVQVHLAEQDPNSVYDKQTKDWQKQVIHFGGGSNAYEQNLFQTYLNRYRDTISNIYFGGNVSSFFKTTSNPIDPVTVGKVSERISKGVSMMTFFGHASADGFDQNVDNPEEWNNSGKYPVVLGNACFTGDIFQPESQSTSEKWLKVNDLGAIAFLSTVKLGFIGSLNTYSSELYSQIARESYGESLGKAMFKTNQQLYPTAFGIFNESSLFGMTLHGDPALKINPHEKPEFDITVNDVYFSPETIDLSVDSITASLIVTNLGKAYDGQIAVEMVREFPGNGGDSTYLKVLEGLYYKDTVHFTIPLYANIGVGLNTFKFNVDIPTQIEEQYDDFFNNTIEKTLFIDIDGIYPVWPYDYAVVPDDTITLKASTVNPFAQMNTYRFEIDTTDLFNSPEKRFCIKTGLGGVYQVAPDEWMGGSPGSLQLTDSTVYFWRVGIDSTDILWQEHSFQYIENKVGWGQDHFFQFKNDIFSGLGYNRADRLFEYEDTYKVLDCEVYGNASNVYEWAGTLWRLNGQIQESNICGLAPALHVAVIDPLTLEPWGTFNNGQNPDHQFGNINNGAACRDRVEYYFNFRQNTAGALQDFENLVLNEVPDSFYVLIYSGLWGDFDNWSLLHPNLFTTFTQLGSDSIVPGHPNMPFILFTKKGDPSSTREVMGQDINEFITLRDTLFGVDYAGRMKSTVIGPADEWKTVYWKQDALEFPTSDSSRLKIYGRDFSGVETLLIDTLMATHDSILNFNDAYPSSSYPMLRLETVKYDSVDFTPAQLDGWHVLHTPVPEAAIDGINGYYFTMTSDSIMEGAELSLGVDIRNISPYDMDSLLVSYKIEDQNRIFHTIPYPRQDSLRAGETLRDTITFSTKGFPGFNSLWIEVNPYDESGIKDQPEMYHFNNVALVPFKVFRDDENPILDVTFDGIHILQGDIVSGRPEILMTLKDENPYLIMDSEADTSLFGIFITDPEGNQRKIYFSGNDPSYELEFIPANASNKKFMINYRPILIQDGEYTLMVQGADKSNNLSGDFEYKISFEVINNSTITHLMNYPNPFSTRTSFVFTLTGNQVPDYMKIQIMTVTGKVVREITMDELGPIRVGRNITEYAWDGRDEFGDQLANGVYLYRVIAEIDGESIEHRSSGADEYFRKGFGKMYLMR